MQHKYVNIQNLVIAKYKEIKLDEFDCIIIFLLLDQLSDGICRINTDYLSTKMTISKNEISRRIVELINREIIVIENENSSETYHFNNLYKMLLVENKSENDLILDMVSYIEKRFFITLSPIDIEIVKNWFVKFKMDTNQLTKLIDTISNYGEKTVRYVNKVIINKNNAK